MTKSELIDRLADSASSLETASRYSVFSSDPELLDHFLVELEEQLSAQDNVCVVRVDAGLCQGVADWMGKLARKMEALIRERNIPIKKMAALPEDPPADALPIHFEGLESRLREQGYSVWVLTGGFDAAAAWIEHLDAARAAFLNRKCVLAAAKPVGEITGQRPSSASPFANIFTPERLEND